MGVAVLDFNFALSRKFLDSCLCRIRNPKDILGFSGDVNAIHEEGGELFRFDFTMTECENLIQTIALFFDVVHYDLMGFISVMDACMGQHKIRVGEIEYFLHALYGLSHVLVIGHFGIGRHNGIAQETHAVRGHDRLMGDGMTGKGDGCTRADWIFRADDARIIDGVFDFFQRAKGRAPKSFLQKLIATDVIDVKMGVDDGFWCEVMFFQHREQGGFFLAACINQNDGVSVHVNSYICISDSRRVCVTSDVFHRSMITQMGKGLRGSSSWSCIIPHCGI